MGTEEMNRLEVEVEDLVYVGQVEGFPLGLLGWENKAFFLECDLEVTWGLLELVWGSHLLLASSVSTCSCFEVLYFLGLNL